MSGCPCGTQGKCCNKTETYRPEHECTKDKEVCEGCYHLECRNCGAECNCEL